MTRGHHFIEVGNRRWCLGCDLWQQRTRGGGWWPDRKDCQWNTPWAKDRPPIEPVQTELFEDRP